ncbi:MAG: acyl carrier protein [Corynebacteriales bacterium]|nr:acyl carrier protein [Mycobacteriales bacterium]
MSDQQRCEQVIRAALAAQGQLAVPVDSLRANDDLHAHGLTSLRSVRVLLAIEAELGIEFPEDRLGRSLFTSIENLVAEATPLVPSQGGPQ